MTPKPPQIHPKNHPEPTPELTAHPVQRATPKTPEIHPKIHPQSRLIPILVHGMRYSEIDIILLKVGTGGATLV